MKDRDKVIEVLVKLADKMYMEGSTQGRFTDEELLEELQPFADALFELEGEPKKAKEILKSLAKDIIERKQLPTELANWNNLKYDSVDVIEAMTRYGKAKAIHALIYKTEIKQITLPNVFLEQTKHREMILFTHLWVDDFGWENTVYNSGDFDDVELLAETDRDGKVYLCTFSTGARRILKFDPQD